MPVSSNIKKVKISLCGASGKMGHAILKEIEEDPELIYSEKDGDVLIDFSSEEGTLQAIEKELPLVCGTTNLSPSTFLKLEDLAKKVPVLYSPNFSLGITFFNEILKEIGEKIKKFSTLSIKEIHHKEKKDSPSGTALHMASLLHVNPSDIVSEREGEIVGIHQVKFQFSHETLVIRHEAYSRKAFALGALSAAKFIFNKPPKLFSLSDIFLIEN